MLTEKRKSELRMLVTFLVCGNVVIFFVLALLNKISGDPQTIVFVDFWGRFVVYTLWFVGYALYRKYLADDPLVRTLVILALCVNIPSFLLLNYFNIITVTPENLAIIDFWGRLTVYSLWFMLYESYRMYLSSDSPGSRSNYRLKGEPVAGAGGGVGAGRDAAAAS